MAVLFFILVWSPLSAQENDSGQMILIAVPKRMELQSESVERLVRRAKDYRSQQNLSVDSLPIVRLSNGVEAHGNVLRELGLRKLEQPVVYMCRRGLRGWPVALLEPLTLAPISVGRAQAKLPISKPSPMSPAGESSPRPPAGESSPRPAVQVVSPGGQQNPSLSPNLEVGYLLYYQTQSPEASAQVKSLVKELGRFWLERYGRARPAPFPLSFYDASNPEVKAKVSSRWPEMGDGSRAILFLASYRGKRPEAILASVEDLDLPAQAIRSAASLRRRWQNEVQLTPGGERPKDTLMPEPVSLDGGEETYLLVLRIRELAQQIWSSTERGPQLSPETKKGLIVISELSRKYLDGDEKQLPAVLDALAKFQQREPSARTPNARLRTVWMRFRSLSKQLLQNR